MAARVRVGRSASQPRSAPRRGSGDVIERRLGDLEIINRAGMDLLPIAMTRPGERDSDPDLFAVVKHHRPDCGRVFWFADEGIDRFENFDAFFLAMLDYNREELQDLSKSIEERNRLM